MEDGKYLACPSCGKISTGKGWTARVESFREYKIYQKNNAFELEERINEDTTMQLKHYCGNGYCILRDTINPQWVMVEIKDRTIISVGEYYAVRPEGLHTVLQVNNLRLSKKLEKKLFRDNKRK